MKGLRALLVTLTLAAGLIGLLAGLRWQSGRLLAIHWQNRLAMATEDEAAELLAQAAVWGETGIPVLVEAMNSPRRGVAEAARETLWKALGDWDKLPRREASRRLLVLAEALAQRADQFRRSARTDASELATQILLRPLDETAVPAWRVTAACDKVLTAAAPPPAGGQVASGAAAGASAASPRIAGEPSTLGPQPNRPASLVSQPPEEDRETDLHADGIPLRAVGSDGGPATLLNQPSRLFDRPRPIESGETPAAPALLPDQLKGRDTADRNPLRSERTIGERELVRVAPQPRIASPYGESSPVEEVPEPVGIDVDTVDVMRRLQAANPAVVAEAQAELQRRGFTEVQLELARRLFDPDPEVRRQLVRVLPEMRSIDATPWLLQLCWDSSPEVRRAAFSLMATTTDPRLLERLVEIARRDPDPSIQRQAERLAGRREAQRDAREVRRR